MTEVGGGHPVLHAQEADDVLIRAKSQADDGTAQFPALPALQVNRFLQLSAGDQLGFHKHFA